MTSASRADFIRRTWRLWSIRSIGFLALGAASVALGAVGFVADYKHGTSWTFWFLWLVAMGVAVWLARRRIMYRPGVYVTGPGFDVAFSRYTASAGTSRSESASGILCIVVGILLLTSAFPAFLVWMKPPPPNIRAGAHAGVLLLSAGIALILWPSQARKLRRLLDRFAYVGFFLLPNTFVDYALKSFGIDK